MAKNERELPSDRENKTDASQPVRPSDDIPNKDASIPNDLNDLRDMNEKLLKCVAETREKAIESYKSNADSLKWAVRIIVTLFLAGAEGGAEGVRLWI
jgi:hypothetical protein